MKRSRAVVAVATASVLALAACSGASSKAEKNSTVGKALGLQSTTVAGKGDAGSVVWASYRPVQTLDPTMAYDFPEALALDSLCESVLRLNPDGTSAPGLATLSYPSPTQLQLKVTTGAKFWDGKPVTASDIVASLERARDKSSGSFWAGDLADITSIKATNAETVNLTLKTANYLLEGFLAGGGAIVNEATFIKAAGKKFGTPAGGTMCSGPYKLQSWQAGGDVVEERNDNYWGTSKAVTKKITIRGVTDEATIQAGLQTGEITGYYPIGPFAGLTALRRNTSVTVDEGPSHNVSVMIPLSYSAANPLGNVKVRQALNMALDRASFIKAAYQGEALLPRTLANVGTWGDQHVAFQKDWTSLKDPIYDIAAAKKLVKDAGAAGKTFVIGSSETTSISESANLIYTAANKIGLKAQIKQIPASQYVNLFFDPKSRGNVNAAIADTYAANPQPGALYASFADEGGSQNFGGYNNAAITALLSKVRATANPAERAKLVIQVGHAFNTELPVIPLVLPINVSIHSKKVTGAPSSDVYLYGPWASKIGSVG